MTLPAAVAVRSPTKRRNPVHLVATADWVVRAHRVSLPLARHIGRVLCRAERLSTGLCSYDFARAAMPMSVYTPLGWENVSWLASPGAIGG